MAACFYSPDLLVISALLANRILDIQQLSIPGHDVLMLCLSSVSGVQLDLHLIGTTT
jgi:hypothetical protein